MRRATQDVNWVRSEENGPIIGISLGYDRVAEHEFGIGRFERAFGIGKIPTPDEVFEAAEVTDEILSGAGVKKGHSLGFESRLMSSTPSAVYVLWHEDGKDAYLQVGDGVQWSVNHAAQKGADILLYNARDELTASTRDGSLTNEALKASGYLSLSSMKDIPYFKELSPSLYADLPNPKTGNVEFRKVGKSRADRALWLENTSGIRTAWSEGDFAVHARGEESVNALRDIRNGLIQGNMTLGIRSKQNPFSGSGLVILHYDRIPMEWKAEALRMDLEHRNLQLACERTGVKEALRKAGLGNSFLEPKWRHWGDFDGIEGMQQYATEMEKLVFWLNPSWDYRSPQAQALAKAAKAGWYNAWEIIDWAEGRPSVVTNDVRGLNEANARLRERMDPEGVQASKDALVEAGFDQKKALQEEAIYSLTPMLDEEGRSIAYVTMKKDLQHGWYSGMELAAWQRGDFEPLVTQRENRNEIRQREDITFPYPAPKM
jgi:hypothetical protein